MLAELLQYLSFILTLIRNIYHKTPENIAYLEKLSTLARVIVSSAIGENCQCQLDDNYESSNHS